LFIKLKDDVRALEAFRKAAEQGFASAQCNVAWMYENGHGTLRNNRDIKEAYKWYKLAADNGEEYAKKRVAALYSYIQKQKRATMFGKITSAIEQINWRDVYANTFRLYVPGV